MAGRPQLSEFDARQLLAKHCRVVWPLLWFDALHDKGADATQKWMTLVVRLQREHKQADGVGFELRLAIDVVNALCACRGFAPHRNPRFWRSVLASMWTDPGSDPVVIKLRGAAFGDCVIQPPAHSMLPFHKAAFSCYSVDCTAPGFAAWPEPIVTFWTQLAWTPSHNASTVCPREILERRGNVMTYLQRFAACRTPVRTLQLELQLPLLLAHAFLCRDAMFLPHFWQPFERGVQLMCTACTENMSAVAPVQLHGSSLPTSHELSITARATAREVFVFVPSNLCGFRQVVANSYPHVQCLSLDAALVNDGPDLPADDSLSLFGELLRTLLLDTKTLKVLRLVNAFQHGILSVVCSLLPVVTCLQELSFNGATIDIAKRDEKWRWIAYALNHPLRKAQAQNLPQQTGLNMVGIELVAPADAAMFHAACHSPTPLRGYAEQAIATAKAAIATDTMGARGDMQWQCQWFPMGEATVTTPQHVYSSPILNDNSQIFAAVASSDARLEVVVRLPSRHILGVVVRGLGLCWMHDDDGITPTDDDLPTAWLGSAPRLTHFRIRSAMWSKVETVLQCLDGHAIRSLAFKFVQVTFQVGGPPRVAPPPRNRDVCA